MRSVAGLAQIAPPAHCAIALSCGRKRALTKFEICAQPLAVELERRMHVEAGLPAGAGRAVGTQRRMAVGDEHDAREVAADHRLQRGAQLARSRRKAARSALSAPSTVWITPRPNSTRSRGRIDDHVGDEAGEIDVVRADGEQHEVERAIRPRRAARAVRYCCSCVTCAGTVLGQLPVGGAVELARALRAEHAVVDRRAGAGERQERHRDVRVLDRERQRGAQLIAVERAMAGLAQPARAERASTAARSPARRARARRCGRR